VVARLARPAARLILTDVNPLALTLARVNAAFAGLEAQTVTASGLDGVDGPIELAVANPPYIAGGPDQAYADGGDMLGGRLSLDWALAAARKLAPGGRLLLYTGSAIVGGRDALGEALQEGLAQEGCAVRYREIDPDVFGATLRRPAYRDVERIAAVGCVAVKG
jgi:methylase of polypeptide subunit release factors